MAVVVEGKGFRVTPPPGWESVRSGADLAFRHPSREAGLMALGTCNDRTRDRPLSVLARHLRFGLRDVRDLVETPVALAGQGGLRSRFTARLEGVPVAVSAVTVRGRRCVYDLVGVAPAESPDTVAADFEGFVASFALTGGD